MKSLKENWKAFLHTILDPWIVILLIATAAQSASGQTAQHQTIVKPAAKPVQQPSQQLITFTAEQLDEYGNEILDRSETFYSHRMTELLWIMGIIIAAGLAIVGVLIPMILEWQRRKSFEKEMSTRLQEFKEYTEKRTKELKTELIIATSSNFSMAFSALGGLLSSQTFPAGYDLMLQSHVLAMKFSIIAQCSGGCLTASEIIELFTRTDIGSEITLKTLEAVDAEIEDMKGCLDEITDDDKRVDMKSQVKELQIYVHALLHKKQQTTPPQAGPQEDERT